MYFCTPHSLLQTLTHPTISTLFKLRSLFTQSPDGRDSRPMCLLLLPWKVDSSRPFSKTTMGMLCALFKDMTRSMLLVKPLPSVYTRPPSLLDSHAPCRPLLSLTALTLENPTGCLPVTSTRWTPLTNSTFCPLNSMLTTLTLSMLALIHSKLAQ